MPNESYDKPLTVEDLQAARSHAVRRVIALLEYDEKKCEACDSYRSVNLTDTSIDMIGAMSASVGMLSAEIERLQNPSAPSRRWRDGNPLPDNVLA